MKHLKKLGGILLALVMVLALAAPAFADEANPGTITLKNPNGIPVNAVHAYNVYRVFDMARSADGGSVSYTVGSTLKEAIEANDSVKGFFTFSAVTGKNDKFFVTATDSYNEAAAKAFSQWLNEKTDLLTKVNNTAIELTGPDATQELEVPYGYYFVDSTVGSLFMLDSTNPEAEITDKNLDPTIEKTAAPPANVEIGDVIDYTIKVNVVEGSTDYVLHDKLGNGLQLDVDSIAVKIGDVDVAEGSYTLKTTGLDDGCAFEIEFPADYLATIPNEQIVVTYKAAILDTAAIPEGADVIQLENEAKVSYGDDKETTPGTTTNELYQFDLVKTNNDNKLLDGAEFELYDGEDVTVTKDSDGKDVYTLNEGALPIKFTYNAESKTYRVSTAEGASSTIKVEGGKVTVDGVNGTYYLKETKAPGGYNELTTLVQVVVTEKNNNATIEADTWSAGGVQVINNSGTELPSTGGIGTTIFYIVGGVLVVGAVVLLIAKRRTSLDEE